MWKLSDETLKKLESEIERIFVRAEEIAGKVEDKWREIPEPVECKACGVDGSRGLEKLSSAILYFVTSVGVGEDLKEMSEVTVLKPHINIEERIRLHMHTSEFRIGSFADEEIVLLDGSLRGAFIRPASYIDDPKKLMESYELESFVQDFLEILDKHFETIGDDLRKDNAKKNYLLSREEVFLKMEEGYRKGEKRVEDLMIFAEYLEYLHSLNRLLEKNAVFIAKNFYTHEFDSEITDAAILELLSIKQFGFEKAGYIIFKPRIGKILPWFVQEQKRSFKNLFKEINLAFVRFEDHGGIYLVESTEKIDEDLIAKLKSLEVDGYPLQLLQAHKLAKIKRAEIGKLVFSLISSLKPEYFPLFKRGREIVEDR